MRIATLIIGLLLGLLMTIQVLFVNAVNNIGSELGSVEAQEQEGALAAGLFVMFLWLVGIAFVIPFPKVSVGSFGIAAPIAFLVASDSIYADMYVWGSISIILSVMSFFGIREKRRKDDEAAQMKAFMQQTMGVPVTHTPPSTPSVMQTAHPVWMSHQSQAAEVEDHRLRDNKAGVYRNSLGI